jgi:hypothetical protein
MRHSKTRARVAAGVATFAFIALLPTPALAGFRSRGFGPAIDSTSYDGQDQCSPAAKPGVLAFRSMVLNSFPVFGYGGISRACNIGGTSEHKEGRAWDMSANAGYESHRKAVKRLFEKLLGTDRYGNEAALARRLGIMYVIWNRKIWGSWGGWSTYCVQKARGCVDPDDGGLRHPHTDHVHFSFTWAGAKKESTYYHRDRSMIASIASHPAWGYWLVGRNGSVNTFETGWYGSRSDRFLDKPAIAMASTLSGYGYWMVTSAGRIFAFGDAKNRGFIKDARVSIVDIEVTPTGKGYWLLAKSGRVFAFGDAQNHGGAKKQDTSVSGMAATPTGLGYWLFGTGGNVFAFGDAQDLGGLAGDAGSPIVGGDNFGATGYWLATAKGRVAVFGDATRHGDASTKNVSGVIVGISANPAGNGYWLATSKGRVLSFGKAPALGSVGAQDVSMLNSVRMSTIVGD